VSHHQPSGSRNLPRPCARAAGTPSRPAMPRWENAPDPRTLIRTTRAIVDLWCTSCRRMPKAITLDIDDTADTVHGHQQLSLFKARHDERCFLPARVHDADTGHCALTILRPGKTPDGKEASAHLRRLVRRIRLHWSDTRITIRSDGHCGRREALAGRPAVAVCPATGPSPQPRSRAASGAGADCRRPRRRCRADRRRLRLSRSPRLHAPAAGRRPCPSA
jgi:hypothetical protein